MNQLLLFSSLVCTLGIVFSLPVPDNREYPLKLQPELDNFDVSSYIKNARLMKFQFKCIIFDGPCDIVGRWAKPRAKSALLGQCDVCTEKQKQLLKDWYEILVEKFPDMYRAAVAKYIENEGITIDQAEKDNIQSVFESDDAEESVQDVFPTIANTPEPKTPEEIDIKSSETLETNEMTTEISF